MPGNPRAHSWFGSTISTKHKETGKLRTMRERKSSVSGGPEHRFGGDWTSIKLEILKQYLVSYSTALKNQPFKRWYIDAFAGTGYRTLKRDESDRMPIFPDLAEDDTQGLLDGSARIALKVDPPFDRYVFIERNSSRCQQLEGLRDEFPERSQRVDIIQGEANFELQRLCQRQWQSLRAVIFLDPYGMQVEWETISKIAATGAIDLWLLVPFGIGINRLLPRSGDVPESWRQCLDRFLGSNDWYHMFYREERTPALFTEYATMTVKANLEEIGEYFLERLRSVFPGVAPKPRILSNSANCPLYLLCFAVSSPNPRARAIALRMARHILDRV